MKCLLDSIQRSKLILNSLESQTNSIIRSNENSSRVKVWVPKTLVLISVHPFYDYLSLILKDLVKQFRAFGPDKGFKDIIEAYLFKIVMEIPAPLKDKVSVKYNGINIVNVDTQELPYVADEFFRVLFENLHVNTVIKIFTHMLCQTPVIIAAKSLEVLVPIH